MAVKKMTDMKRVTKSFAVHHEKTDTTFIITMLYEFLCDIDVPNMSDTNSEWQITWNDGDDHYYTKYIRITAMDQSVEAINGRPEGLMAFSIFTNKDRFEELIAMVTLNENYNSYVTLKDPKTKRNRQYEYSVTIM